MHRKMREAGLELAQQVAARITDDHDVIAVEDLAMAGMARISMATSVHETGRFLCRRGWWR